MTEFEGIEDADGGCTPDKDRCCCWYCDVCEGPCVNEDDDDDE